eukprot:scaffold16396_cov140-Cylindrotheca_fusiformis.AAC.13
MEQAGTGILLGVVHVLTGPDHLSALATLSAAVPDCWTSFFLGVRWGFGHSFGLLLVGTILIARDLSSSSKYVEVPDSISHLFETFVGIFMLMLGLYGFRRAFRKRREYEGSIPISNDDSDNDEEEEPNRSQRKVDDHRPFDPTAHESYHEDPLDCLHDLAHRVADSSDIESTLELDDDPLQNNDGNGNLQYISRFSQRFSARTLAVLAGIIHGLAGPGGVLGVIPAVQLHDWKLATLYLGCFCTSSTLTMGCFASLYGTLTSSVGRQMHVEFQIHCFSSGLSILVGVTWLVLLSMGKLEDVFP